MRTKVVRLLTASSIGLFSRSLQTVHADSNHKTNKIDIRGLPKADLAEKLMRNAGANTYLKRVDELERVDELLRHNNGRLRIYVDRTLAVTMDLSGNEIDPSEYDENLKGKVNSGYTFLTIKGVQECVDDIKQAMAIEQLFIERKQLVTETFKQLLGKQSLQIETTADLAPKYDSAYEPDDYVSRTHLINTERDSHGSLVLVDLVIAGSIDEVARIISKPGDKRDNYLSVMKNSYNRELQKAIKEKQEQRENLAFEASFDEIFNETTTSRLRR